MLAFSFTPHLFLQLLKLLFLKLLLLLLLLLSTCDMLFCQLLLLCIMPNLRALLCRYIIIRGCGLGLLLLQLHGRWLLLLCIQAYLTTKHFTCAQRLRHTDLCRTG